MLNPVQVQREEDGCKERFSAASVQGAGRRHRVWNSFYALYGAVGI